MEYQALWQTPVVTWLNHFNLFPIDGIMFVDVFVAKEKGIDEENDDNTTEIDGLGLSYDFWQ